MNKYSHYTYYWYYIMQETPDNFHIVISRVNNSTYLSVTQECNRFVILGLLAEALNMASSSNIVNADPSYNALNLIISVIPDDSDDSDYSLYVE